MGTRACTFVLAAAIGIAAAAPAHAYEFRPGWGYATVDDHPFEANGALLPATQAFPRGTIKDAGTPDGWAVKITVFAFSATGANLFSYSVTERNAVYTAFDKPINVSPNEISYLRYDFCRTTTPAECEPSLRIGRPAPPSPPPGGGGGGSPAPPPVDRDGDGVSPPADCMDTNSTVWPGAREIPGNGIDDDCSGGDQAARLFAVVSSSWSVTRRGARARRLTVREAPPGAQVTVLCRGSRSCPFRSRRLAVDAEGSAALRPLFPHRLRPGAGLEIRITAADMIGRVVRYRIERGEVPVGRTLCLAPGASEPAKC
jgi:hypothetical protein